VKTRIILASPVAVAVCFILAREARADDLYISGSESHLITTRYTYDANSTASETTNAQGFVSRYDYDARGTITDKTTSDTHTYDAQNETTPNVDALGHVSSYTYDDRVTDTHNASSSSSNDSTGSSGTTPPDLQGTTTRYDYNSGAGSAQATEDALGNTTRFQYDANHGAVSIDGADPLGNTTRYTYDAVGGDLNITEAITSNAGETTSGTGSIDLQALTTMYQYDARGALSDITATGPVIFDVQLNDITPGHTGLVFRYDYNSSMSDPPAYGTGTDTGPLTGMLTPGDTYRYSYSYDITGGSGRAALDLNLSATPLPPSVAAGAMLFALTALGPTINRRRRRQDSI
jgi:YD repeat-containing protein